MSIGTILLLLLFLGISLYSRINKAIAAQSVAEGDSAGDMQDDSTLFSEEESLEEESPYFTYESESAEVPAHNGPERKPQPVFSVDAEEFFRPRFDLRQAVIGQVILSNAYIEEINQ